MTLSAQVQHELERKVTITHHQATARRYQPALSHLGGIIYTRCRAEDRLNLPGFLSVHTKRGCMCCTVLLTIINAFQWALEVKA